MIGRVRPLLAHPQVSSIARARAYGAPGHHSHHAQAGLYRARVRAVGRRAERSETPASHCPTVHERPSADLESVRGGQPQRPEGQRPRRAGRSTGWGACHPDDLPEGYHTAARGQSIVDAGGGGRDGTQAVRLALEHCARRDLNGYQPAAHVTPRDARARMRTPAACHDGTIRRTCDGASPLVRKCPRASQMADPGASACHDPSVDRSSAS